MTHSHNMLATAKQSTFSIRLGSALSVIALVSLLAACGDNNDGRGSVNSETAVASVPKAALDAAATAGGVIALTGTAVCDVDIKRISYNTVAGAGEKASTNTALYLPTGTAAACNGKRGVVVYTHGTRDEKSVTLASATNPEAAYLLSLFAAQGYIVIAPEYVGYLDSNAKYHPYLNADQSAADVIDAIQAVSKQLSAQTRVSMGKLFVTGYSQGGHVAMATVRELEKNWKSTYPLAGSVPMSGPYALSKSLTAGLTAPGLGATLFVPMLVDSYQNSYGGIYSKASDIYATPFDTSVVGLFPGAQGYTAALQAGKVPLNMLPSQGAPFLLNAAFVADASKANTTNAFMLAAKKNDLLNFKPAAPMSLCWGAGDPVVAGFNSSDAVAYFASQGVTVGKYDTEAAGDWPGPLAPLYAAFQAQKTAGGAGFVTSYHTAVAPFCLKVAKGMFDQINAAP